MNYNWFFIIGLMYKISGCVEKDKTWYSFYCRNQVGLLLYEISKYGYKNCTLFVHDVEMVFYNPIHA